ncbi:hypothetical protein CcCBS67573_g03500 [Chytriomyces confervae]|uniref:C2H2-type domain-containing protein n=1 Tax=Chytriomyces confervae TaxID=246404 RepID=A0A507FFX2_9FUNG|nr:hypothetical protein CcCBS67573_g03500 [Chytriomyces confervae]
MLSQSMPSTKKHSVMNISNLIDMDSSPCDTHFSDACCHSDPPHLVAASYASSPVYCRDSFTPPTTPSSCNYASSCYTPSPPSEDTTWVQLPPLSRVSPVAAAASACRKAPYTVPLPRKSESISDVSMDNELLPFQCPHCPNRYKTKHYLESHSATHLTARPFVCTLSGGACRGSFRRLSDLRRHMKTVKH